MGGIRSICVWRTVSDKTLEFKRIKLFGKASDVRIRIMFIVMRSGKL